jgi:hypothetical protein
MHVGQATRLTVGVPYRSAVSRISPHSSRSSPIRAQFLLELFKECGFVITVCEFSSAYVSFVSSALPTSRGYPECCMLCEFSLEFLLFSCVCLVRLSCAFSS